MLQRTFYLSLMRCKVTCFLFSKQIFNQVYQLKRLRTQEEVPIKPVGGDKDLKDLKDFKVFKREMRNKEMRRKNATIAVKNYRRGNLFD